MKAAVVALLLALAPAPLPAVTIAITNARIVSLGPAGDIERGTAVVRDGLIAAVGADPRIPAGARIVDAKGGFLTPGLIMAPTPLALKDVITSATTRAPLDVQLSAAYQVADDFNPRHPHVAEARAEGVTTAVLLPDPQGKGRLFAGQAAIVQLGVTDEAIVSRDAAIYLSATEAGANAAGGGLGAVRSRLHRALADARDYGRDPARFDLARLGDTGLSRADLAALVPVAQGRRPLVIEVDRAEAIRGVLRMAGQEGIRLVLSGASEGWIVADEIARARVPVIVDGEANQATAFEDLNASYENAALLTKAGVKVAFKPGFSRVRILDRSPRWTAGRAARYGLPLHDALAAITINPARMFGLDRRLGSIEVGKDADLVLWSGDPFETSSTARMVMIHGVEQPLTARNRQLRDRYIGLLHPGAPAP